MKNRSQNVMCFNARILSIVLLFVGMLAVSPRHARAQTAQARSKECDEILQRIKTVKDRLIGDSSQRAIVRNQIGRTEVDIRNFPERKESLRKFQLQLQAEETEFNKSIEDLEKSFNALLEQLAGCCCPQKTNTDKGPDVPGLEDSSSIPEPKKPEKKLGMNPFKPYQAVGLFSIIREDSTPRFNLSTAIVGVRYWVTPFFAIDGITILGSGKQNGTDLSKASVLGGVTLVPFDGAKTTDKATVFLHALGGISHLKADNGITSFTDNSFTMNLGGGLDVNVNENFFIRPIQIDYAPTFFGNSTQHNVQFGFGAGFRF